MMRLFLACVALSLAATGPSGAQDNPAIVTFLWDGVAPGSEGQNGEEIVRLSETGERVVTNVHRPSLTVYPARGEVLRATTVLIIPGGGHREIWTDHEGHNIAQWLSARGITAAFLKYRLPRQKVSPYSTEHQVIDAKRAVRVLRHRAAEWRVDPEKIGVMGFSAGGELAARVALAEDFGDAAAADPVERQNTQLTFQALVYPAHPEIIKPTKDTPPAFLCWGFGDFPMISEGMGSVYSRFREVGIPVEMHVYSEAGHGFGVRANNHSAEGKWIERFHEWLGSRRLLPTTSNL